LAEKASGIFSECSRKVADSCGIYLEDVQEGNGSGLPQRRRISESAFDAPNACPGSAPELLVAHCGDGIEA
jgi:hypothetical protein